MRAVLAGAGGLLGSEFRALLAGLDVDVIAMGRDELHVEHEDDILAAVSRAMPDLIINCAAHTDLEAAEREPAPDHAANAKLPAILADAARQAGITMLHFSSTGCYGAWKSEPYVEDDLLQPTTAHHRAKRDGELAIRATGCRHIIARTGWLYGGKPGQPKNFVWNRMVEARSREHMQSDAAQRGCPTYAADVATLAMRAFQAGVEGTVNLTAQGAASRYEYVSAIVASAGLPCIVEPGPAFKRLAAVSANETSLNAALDEIGLDQMPEWRHALDVYVKKLTATHEWQSLQSSLRI